MRYVHKHTNTESNLLVFADRYCRSPVLCVCFYYSTRSFTLFFALLHRLSIPQKELLSTSTQKTQEVYYENRCDAHWDLQLKPDVFSLSLLSDKNPLWYCHEINFSAIEKNWLIIPDRFSGVYFILYFTEQQVFEWLSWAEGSWQDLSAKMI